MVEQAAAAPVREELAQAAKALWHGEIRSGLRGVQPLFEMATSADAPGGSDGALPPEKVRLALRAAQGQDAMLSSIVRQKRVRLGGGRRKRWPAGVLPGTREVTVLDEMEAASFRLAPTDGVLEHIVNLGAKPFGFRACRMSPSQGTRS